MKTERQFFEAAIERRIKRANAAIVVAELQLMRTGAPDDYETLCEMLNERRTVVEAKRSLPTLLALPHHLRPDWQHTL